MSLLQFDLPAAGIKDRKVRRALIEAICARIPTAMAKAIFSEEGPQYFRGAWNASRT